MTLRIAPVTRPSDLTGVSNGKLPSNLLVAVQGGKLHHLAARAFNALAMHAYAHAHNMGLTHTHGGLYRTYAQQETLFRSRYDPKGTGGGCKTWNGVKWCKKDSKFATVATPGTSNHGWGLAIDMAWDSDHSDGIGPDDAQYIKSHPGWQWILDNAERFGFSWELQSEPWHIRYVAGDNVPKVVLEWEAFAASLGDAAPAPVPTPAPTPAPPAQGGKYMQWLDTIRLNSFGNGVVVLQALLQSLGYQSQVDGNFGKRTEGNVLWFQGLRGLKQDGVVGPVTWNALGATGPHVAGGETDKG
jgi:LAS superfamily LD-carboxypeptidase LdcB